MVGAKFYNCDFHIHTPASKCYKDKSATSDLIVRAALNKKLSAIAITDHNTFEGIQSVIEAAKDTDLVVFPGFELTAQGGHLIAIFDPNTDLTKLDDALTSCGITKDKRGREDAIGIPFSEALKIIVQDYGGISIAAHADGVKGFLKTIDQGQLSISIYKNKNLMAMELINLENRTKYAEGKDPNYDRMMPCIQGSDAHTIESIGSRSTLLKMHHITAEGILQAFNDPTLNVEFPQNWEAPIFPYIESLKIDKGFLAGQVIEFNSNFNCLLGGAGSGKSTIIEFLRFAFDQVSDNEDIKKDSLGKLSDLATIGSTIKVRFFTQSGEEYIVSRTFNNYDNPIFVRNVKENRTISDNDIKGLFPVHAYSQGEALEISKNHLAQLDLIDKHINIKEFQREIQEAYSNLESQISGLIKLENIIRDRTIVEKKITAYETEYSELNKQLNALKEVQNNPTVKSHQFWIDEKHYLTNLVNSIDLTRKNIIEGFSQIEYPILDINLPENDTPNGDLVIRCQNQAKELTSYAKSARESLLNGLAAIEKKIREDARDWKVGYEEHSQAYFSLIEEKGEQKLKAISDNIEQLKNNQFLAQGELTKIKTAQIQYDNLIQKRNEYLALIKDRKQRITLLRRKKVKDILKSVDNLNMTLTPDGYRQQYINFMTKVLVGSRARADQISSICTNIHPIEFAQLIRNEDIDRIDKLANLGREWAKRVVEQFRADFSNVYRVESLPIEDLLEISFEVERNVYRPLEKLSTGQKATVIVSLSLVEGSSPIIFDQPEDALYSPFIFSNIVKLVRNSKKNRQFIFATHNANIAVGSGLDLGIVLEGSSTETVVRASGSLDDSITKNLVILHLEGGKPAILKRLAAYRLRDDTPENKSKDDGSSK